VRDLQQRIRQTNVEDEEVLRFVVAFSLYLLDQEKKHEEKKTKLRDSEAEKEDKMAGDLKNSQHSEFLGSREYPHLENMDDDEKPENFVSAIKNKLLLGHYDPRNTTQKGLGYAKKATIWLGKKGMKKAIQHYVIPITAISLTPIFPPLLPAWIVANQVHKFTGADHEKLYLVVVQLLLQRLLLAAHGVDINSYY